MIFFRKNNVFYPRAQRFGPAVLGLVVVSIVLTIYSFTAQAAMRKTVTPRISLQQEYDDNIHLEPDNEDSDWITLVSPGISLDLETQKTTMDLDYEAGFSFYRDDSARNSTRHRGRATWQQRLTRYLTLDLNDTFIRSEDPIVETEGAIEDIRVERNIYYRNNGQVSLSYAFGAEDRIGAGYRNRYVDDRSSDDEDSVGHEGFVSLDTWFSQQFGIELTSHYNESNFEHDDDLDRDFDRYGGDLTVNYRWQPSRWVYGRYDFTDVDFEQPATALERNDHQVHQGVLGISMAFGPYTDMNLEGGYFVQDFDDGTQTEGETYAASLTTRTEKTALRLQSSGGYDEDYYSFENLGSSEFRRVLGSVNHLLTENVRIFGSASYRWEEFVGGDAERDRKDEVWRTRGGFSFSFWRWLRFSLEGSHAERDSDNPNREFKDNRCMLRLTGAYPFPL